MASVLPEHHEESVTDEKDGGKKKVVDEKAVQNKPRHLEQRIRRRTMWSTLHFALFFGRVLSKFGMHSAHQRSVRRVCRLGAGIRRAKLPGISHAKALICGVKCRVYRHIGEEGPRPVLIYAHGGGWVMCSARTYHQFTLALCRDTGATVVSIDYRLAPENPYPAGLEDCLAVVRAILHADTNPDEVGPELKGFVDVNRVVMGGDSAGGNLTACVALEMIRAGDDRRLLAEMLICPVVQALTQSLESYLKFSKAMPTGLSWFLLQYAGFEPNRRLMKLITHGKHVPEETSQRLIAKYMTILPQMQANEEKAPESENKQPPSGPVLVPPATSNAESHVETAELIENAVEIPESITDLATCVRAWPILAEDFELAQLPITMIQVCSEDPLLDEGRIFADRMRGAGAQEVRYFFLPRAQHVESVLEHFIHSKASKRGYGDIVSFVKDVTGIENEANQKAAETTEESVEGKSSD